MKRYITPRLVEIGTVNTVTQGSADGSADGDNTESLPAGSLGFNL